MKHNAEETVQIDLRLKKIAGQIAGIRTMIEKDVPCEDVLVQLNAANGAIHKISLMILKNHLRHCVREGIESGKAEETIENFVDALDNFSKMA